MPLVRISDELYEKIHQIIKKTGWKSIGYALDRLLENVNPEDFPSYKWECEVLIKGRRGK